VVSEKHSIYVADVGLTPAGCDALVTTTEQVCKGRYAAYTYAKQTLGCREYPLLAREALSPVHSMVGAIMAKFGGKAQPEPNTNTTTKPMTATTSMAPSGGDDATASEKKDDDDSSKALQPSPSSSPPTQPRKVLQLDDREPHIVKYDVTKKERQKLDMHTDKSEWTFLIALSNGCGLDYEGGGTYFECLDATVHVQKGHALVFPGKLKHKGQAIYYGLRFLLVGFLVDKGDSKDSNSGGGVVVAAASVLAPPVSSSVATTSTTTITVTTITATTTTTTPRTHITPSCCGTPVSASDDSGFTKVAYA
jgi:hypothetical protein